MPTLEVEFLGFKMKNPFILASAPPTNTIEMIERAFEQGWGGAVTKTIPLEKVPVHNVTPRIHSIGFPGFEADARKVYAFGNIELVSEKHADYWMAGITQLRKNWPDRFVMASIMADGSAQGDWVELAQRSEKAGAWAVELNFSCPHGGMPPHAVGAAIGQDPVIAARIVRWVREAVKIPVLVKLTAAVSDLRQLGKVLIDAGADGFCTINSFPVLLGVDLKTHSPMPSVYGKGNLGGYTGRALKPIALRATSEIAPLGKPVSGCGGLTTWEDAAEFVLLGATTLQVCSAVMLEGYGIITDLCDGLIGLPRGAGGQDPRRAAWQGPRQHRPPRAPRVRQADGQQHRPRDLHQVRQVRHHLPRRGLPGHQRGSGSNACRRPQEVRRLRPVHPGLPGVGLHEDGAGRGDGVEALAASPPSPSPTSRRGVTWSRRLARVLLARLRCCLAGPGAGYCVPSRCRMALAARRPSATAWTTVAPPFTRSPPA